MGQFILNKINYSGVGAHGNVEVDPVLTQGTEIATITVNEDEYSLYAPTPTTYNDFTGATSQAAGAHGLVPAPTASDVDKYLKGDGTWHTVSGGGSSTLSGLSDVSISSPSNSQALVYNSTSSKWENTSLAGASDMTGATSQSAGTHGLVPAPSAGDNTKFLRGDGTWQTAGGGGGGSYSRTALYTTPITYAQTITLSDDITNYDDIEFIMYQNPNGGPNALGGTIRCNTTIFKTLYPYNASPNSGISHFGVILYGGGIYARAIMGDADNKLVLFDFQGYMQIYAIYGIKY